MNEHIYHGGCHCHEIRFEIQLKKTLAEVTILQCNCSICIKTGYLHLIIPKKQFELQTNWANLSNYQFNKRIAKHYFCKICGIKSFYQPRSHPDCWSINVRCLDEYSYDKLKLEDFDGKNWQKSRDNLKP